MKKVLFIDDDKYIVSLYLDIFGSAADIYFKVARDGTEGFVTTKNWRPDLVLLDILLPRLEGLGYLQKIRETEDLAKTPVIVVSNVDDADHIAKAEALGIEDYWVKSDVPPAMVLEKVRKVLAGL